MVSRVAPAGVCFGRCGITRNPFELRRHSYIGGIILLLDCGRCFPKTVGTSSIISGIFAQPQKQMIQDATFQRW